MITTSQRFLLDLSKDSTIGTYNLLTTYYVYIFGMYVYKNIVLFILNI